MIPTNRLEVLDAGLEELRLFGEQTNVRGRFVALYLGLRRMGQALSPLGDALSTPAREIEEFLDEMFRKVHRVEPFVVLTAPFGGSTSPTAPYSARSGDVAPGHRYAVNTWRNNFGVQKGIGCPADAETIHGLLQSPAVRLACPYLSGHLETGFECGLTGTAYRGEEHSIWLRSLGRGQGYQVADLDLSTTYEAYLKPDGQSIPIFPLIAAIYGMAPGEFAPRPSVGIAEFATDLGMTLDFVRETFDCNPESDSNRRVLTVSIDARTLSAELPGTYGSRLDRPPNPLPLTDRLIAANSGVGAELAVARELETAGWFVMYRGSQRSVGFDLEATRGGDVLRVEVKSSVSFTDVELLPSEWNAAQKYSDEYVIAVVDFYGSDSQSISYLRGPAAAITPGERNATYYRVSRTDIEALTTEVDYL